MKRSHPGRHFCKIVLLIWSVMHGGSWERALAEEPPVDSSKAAAPREVPWELQPYRVRIRVTFDDSPRWNEGRRTEIFSRLTTRLERTVGRMWTSVIEQDPSVTPPSAEGLDRLVVKEIAPTGNSSPPVAASKKQNDATSQPNPEKDGDKPPLAESDDKVFHVVVAEKLGTVEIAVREWDGAANEFGETIHEVLRDPRDTADGIGRLLVRAFRPLLTVESASDATFQLRLRAGEFPAPDPDAEQVRSGDVVLPFLRYLNRQRVVQRVQTIPWSYLVVQKHDRGKVEALLVSGIRSPLGSGKRRRVDALGLRTRPKHPATRLQMVMRRNLTRPLSGHSAKVAYVLRANDKPQDEPLRLMTNRFGTIVVPLSQKSPIAWTWLYSGEALVAKLPFVPGLREFETVDLPDDSLRLEVEGEIALLKSRLVDAVAKRSVAYSRAKTLAKTGKVAEVKAVLAEIDKLPGGKEFETELIAIRQPAVQKAKSQRDRVAEIRILKLCNEASGLIVRYFDAEKQQTLRDEIDALLNLDRTQ